jgi:hypothetical protein
MTSREKSAFGSSQGREAGSHRCIVISLFLQESASTELLLFMQPLRSNCGHSNGLRKIV